MTDQEEFPCTYCLHPCQYDKDYIDWKCDHCSARFNILDGLISTQLDCTINNKVYSVYLDLPENQTQIWWGYHILFKTNQILNINPSNIKQKLKIYLTFQ
jgi:hypothetical protein